MHKTMRCNESTLRSRIDALMESLERFNSDRFSDVLISCKEAARLLGKTTPTISRMIRDGRLNRTTIDGSTGIRLSEVRDQAAGMR